MVWYVKAVMHNLIGYNLTLADPAAYVTWGSVSQQAPLLRSGQDNIPMAHWQPATGTWTGTTGVAMYKVDGPVGNKLAFGVMMPFIGDNKCSVGVYPDIYFEDPMNPSHVSIDTSINRIFDEDYNRDVARKHMNIRPVWEWTSQTPKYKTWCTIEQGKEVTANFYIAPYDYKTPLDSKMM
ncbi:uncharacterized protein E0L32_000318 [Thyridium curvatum]|uniref:Uncharacterized protein n=1 Tax=Thyridium curvatum TaxID=1093900 RepID=A0A507BBG7_9PEZI|nr:uncharacterized protein E0L32_000318 [Thyridium curvatum]TPX15984.1 hypothetical protein E0L32_000318 [Thyridium curvatum]